MHCPNCGDESPIDQKFCRKCGFDLAPVARLFAGDAPAEDIELTAKERDQILVKRMFRWISAGLIVLGFGLLMLIVGRSGLIDAGKIFGLASSVLMIIGIALAAYGLISSVTRSVTLSRKSGAAAGINEFTKAPTTRQLEHDRTPVPLPSVTERTTELINKKG
jgi:hypothetical protein